MPVFSQCNVLKFYEINDDNKKEKLIHIQYFSSDIKQIDVLIHIGIGKKNYKS